ncbi:SPOR domain-containing protein [Stenotrophomonas rhizophila]|uniref:SPOR domain-containing protein n=1 Tax=Stenotrophomonas rhizophila TaxID=216778 RepID=UPI001E4713BC|nr:SPOR domain-containing protein [Stenotrophomonas rhizophila]MCC7633010.1 SPOR domain-containing protein [Stenotrophomonas rhizophila]MCC7661903.1 SPOR domain-containing protein [Stenotrophomonas rhizophila]
MAARRGKSQARRNSSQGTPGWVWLVAGVAIAAVVFLAAPNLFKSDGDGFLRVGPKPDPNAQPAPVSDADPDVGAELPKPGTAPAEPAKPAATQYDFYTLLPGKEVEMSDAELAASARAEDQRRAKAEAQRAQAALEGRPVPAGTATATPAATVATATPATVTTSPLPAPVTERPAATTTPAATPATAAATTAPKPAATAAATPAAADPAASNVRYILQAGAFGASGDAEATKAKLAMIGLAARVESAQINGKTVYRVRMGPYGSAGELAEAKQKLDGTGLQAMAIKAQ